MLRKDGHIGLTCVVIDLRELSRDLAAALAREQVFAMFQPQFEMQSGDIVAVEALARWRHPVHGLIAPEVFIPLAEANGVIHELGRFMLRASLSAVDAWQDAGSCIEVSVNVSPAQLNDPGFFDLLTDALACRSMPAHALTIEITESLPITDFDVVVPRLERVRAMGLGLSLDDFGTGYASADQLDRLPVTELKIDKTLIQSGDERVTSEALVTVAHAHESGLRVVAEGIETNAHLDVARSLGCDRAQGYLLARPMVRSAVDLLVAA